MRGRHERGRNISVDPITMHEETDLPLQPAAFHPRL